MRWKLSVSRVQSRGVLAARGAWFSVIILPTASSIMAYLPHDFGITKHDAVAKKRQ
jgi:hypothetical protein